MWVLAPIVGTVLVLVAGPVAAETLAHAPPEAMRSPQFVVFLPEHQEAAALHNAVDRYRLIAKAGGWPQQSYAQRAFSHGCVRVAEPAKLAAALLADEGWTHSEVERAMHGNYRRVIVLPDPVPVYLLYMTSWVDGDGSVYFRKDIYRHDAAAP